MRIHKRVIKFIFIIVMGLVSSSLFGQYKEYAFNAPGNSCYMRYLNFIQNGDYKNIKHPFIFVLGPSGSTGKQAYLQDTLHNLPKFNNFEFIFLQNPGTSSDAKLSCISSLVEHTTSDLACGKTNVFLMIYDGAITEADIQEQNLSQTFHSIQIVKSSSEDTAPIDNFKEDLAAYDYVPIEEDEIGSFYVEKNDGKKSDERVGFVQSKKTYFGAPTAFNVTINGVIRDVSTGESLPFSTIKIEGFNAGATSNMDGLFSILKVPSDTSVLIVSSSGYYPQKVFLDPNSINRNLVIELSPQLQLVGEVKVYGDRQEIVLSKKDDVGVIKMTPKLIEKLPNLGEKDILRSFQLMPGVSGSQESSSGMYVRGGTPDQNLVLFDGFTIYHVDHLYGFFSAFNANTVKDIQLYKGGYESRFGGRLSSVTEITGKDGNQKKLNLGGDISLLSFNVFAEIPIGEKFTSIIAFRRSFQSPIYKKLFKKFSNSDASSSADESPSGGPGIGGRVNNDAQVSSFFYDLNGKFTYHLTSKDILSLSFFNSKDKVDNSSDFNGGGFGGGGNSNFSFVNKDITKYGNLGSSLRWGHKWSDKLYGNTILSFSNFYSNREQSNERTSTDDLGNTTTSKTGIAEDNNLVDYSLKSDYSWDLSKNFQLQFGAFTTYYDIDYSYTQNDTIQVLNKSNQALSAGAYLQNRFKFFDDRLIIVPGIRANYFETTNKFYLEPRASMIIKLTKTISLKGATGKYNQFANRVTREDIMSGSKEFWLLSDGINIPVSSSVHFMGGVSYETPQLLFGVDAYYKKINNITEYSLRINAGPNGVGYDENFFSGNGTARGVEFLVQRKTGKLNGWMSYTLGEAKSYFDAYSDTYFYSNQDVTHEFKTVLMYEYKRWNFSSTWIFATGRPYTAPSGAYSITLLDGTTQDYFTVSVKNGLRLPNYHRADISVNYKLLAGEKGDSKRREIGSIGFSIFNFYNRNNVWYKTYSIEDGTIVETNVNYTGITPNLTLSLKLR